MARQTYPWDEPDRAAYPHFNYFLTEAAQARYVLAAHYLKGCEHIVEIGGSRTPITKFIDPPPASIVVVDPKMAPFHAESLAGRPCRVDHVRTTFQAHDFELAGREYGLVILGLSLKHFGEQFGEAADSASPGWRKLIALVRGARTAVIEYALDWELGRREAEAIVAGSGCRTVMRLDLDLGDNEGEDTPFRRRRFMVLEPGESGAAD